MTKFRTDSHASISRRKLVLGVTSGFVLTGYPRQVSAQSAMNLPYLDSIVQLPGQFASCEEIRRLIALAEGLRVEIANPDVVDALIASRIQTRDRLIAEIASTENVIDSLDNENVIAKISIFLGLAFAAAALIVEAPLAIAAVMGLQVLSGTTIFALQAVYTTTDTPTLVAGYSKDRVLIFGAPVAEQAGSTGGKVVFNALEMVSLASDVYSLGTRRSKVEDLRVRLRQMIRNATALKEYFERYPPASRGPWRAIFDTNLQGTIRQLQSIIDNYENVGCVVLPQPGPVIVPG